MGVMAQTRQSAQIAAVCTKAKEPMANVMTATSMLHAILAQGEFGVVIGSVIMKKVNSSRDPFIIRWAQTSVPQPR